MSHLAVFPSGGEKGVPSTFGGLPWRFGDSACPGQVGVEGPKCPPQVCELEAPISPGKLVGMVRMMSEDDEDGEGDEDGENNEDGEAGADEEDVVSVPVTGVPGGGAVQWPAAHGDQALQRVPGTAQAGETPRLHRKGTWEAWPRPLWPVLMPPRSSPDQEDLQGPRLPPTPCPQLDAQSAGAAPAGPGALPAGEEHTAGSGWVFWGEECVVVGLGWVFGVLTPLEHCRVCCTTTRSCPRMSWTS